MMMKITTLVATCLVAAGLAACGGGSNGGDEGALPATVSSTASSSQASNTSSNSSSAASSTATAAITIHMLGDSTIPVYSILMTPMVRLDMSNRAVTAVGQHDYSSTKKGSEANPRGNYPAAMKAVASKYGVPLVDITSATASIVNSFGKDAAAASFYVSGDSTHPQIMFASLIAKKATEGIKGLSSLSELSA